jgi:hypothetical protein
MGKPQIMQIQQKSTGEMQISKNIHAKADAY